MLTIGTGNLSAQPRGRHDLAGVGEPVGIERAAQTLERGEVGFLEHRRHVGPLVDPDPVLAGDGAARIHARLDDQSRQLLGAFRLALAPGVVADERMQIAIPGVEHVGDAELILVGESIDPAQDLREPGAGDDPVLNVVGRREPAHRGERRLAGTPDEVALGIGLGDADIERPCLRAEPGQLLQAGDAPLVGPVELDEQRGAGIEPVSGAGGLLGRLDRQTVHHLDRAGNDAGIDDRAHRIPGVGGVGEEREHRTHRLRRRDHPQRDLRGHAERALGADERPQEVVAGVIAAQRDRGAVGEHDIQREHVVGREPVLEAVRAARVLGDVAADRAHDLARGIRRIEVRRRDRPADREVRHPGLHDDAPVVERHREDPAQPREHDQHAVGDRECAARESGAGPAGHPGDLGLVTRPDRLADLLGAPGQDGRDRDLAIVEQAVGAIGRELVLVGQHELAAAYLLQAGDQPGRANVHHPGVSPDRRSNAPLS